LTDTDYTDRLRLIAVNDRLLTAELWGGTGAESDELDPKTRALVQLAALVAVGGPASSYGALADAAVNMGASPAEMVEVVVSVAPVVGLPRTAAAAAALAMALGCDIDNGLDS
jgi:alkylhydroperoxidase/carboxymuconolactone decarboxylase family protein YurZ